MYNMEFILKTIQIPQEVRLQWTIIIILWMIIGGCYLCLISYFIIDWARKWNLRH